MAPESNESGVFANPFAAGSPFALPDAVDAPEPDPVGETDAPQQPEAPAAGAAFGLVFQAADPQQRLPKRERPHREIETGSDDEPAEAEAAGENRSDEDASADDAGESRAGKNGRSRRKPPRADAHGGSEPAEHGRHDSDDEQEQADSAAGDDAGDDGDGDDEEQTPRRRRRGGRGRRSSKGGSDTADAKGGKDGSNTGTSDDDDAGDDESGEVNDASSDDEGGSRKRTRRRRRSAAGGAGGGEQEEPNTVTKVREPRRAKDEVTSIKGSTRLEAKKQRRREGREAGRRRTVITEAEFLARRESVERVMVVREQEGRTQIGVLEDGVLAEHYVSRQEQASSMAGNVYLGRVQNVLPSMEAAFVDIGRGRNAVLYAGEVNWDAAGLDNQPKRIEHALKAGESVLVQVTKDPIGHKGARLTAQISLPGRFVVFVPGNSMTGISRKLPDTERARLKKILKEAVPAGAGVIVRTAAEGASEEELRADVERLMKLWEKIQKKAETASAPSLLHGEPDLTVRVIRDVFNEDFAKMVVSGERAWGEVHGYISEVAPDLAPRLEQWTGDADVFAQHRIDEQLAKAMDRKVWLPSGGSLVIDRTEAMTVVDVNTGKFVGSGGNLEETVTKNNIEAAEEIVRQLRLRDIGGIIVVDFIDMVLESNRELVVRRLLECLGRDRTKHQVAEVTSLGLVQMTRKRVGSGLVEVFSEPCESCQGRGIVIHDHPVENRDINGNDTSRKGRGARGGRGGRDGGANGSAAGSQETTSGEKQEARDNGFAQIAAAAHAAAISAGDKSATSDPVSTATNDDAVMTASPDAATPVQAAGEVRSSGDSAPAGDKPRRSGRVQRRSERAAQTEDMTQSSTSGEPAAPSGAAARSRATEAPTSERPAAKRRGARRAATSMGAPTVTGEAVVISVPASTADGESATPAVTEPAATQRTASDVGAASSAPSTPTGSAARRPRRRAGSSAGAPVALQPVDFSSAAASPAQPLTKVAGSATASAAPVEPAASSEATADARMTPARKKRARVSSPAGAPTATPQAQD